MVLQGVQLLWLPFNGVTVLDYNSSVILTVLLIVVTVNAINFIDGLDGLAAGIIGIGSLAFFAFAYLLSVDRGIDRATTAALLSAVLAGICAGFLPHNFNPARIFMGDSGSMLSGLLLSASVITLTGKIDPYAVGDAALLPVLMPLLLPFAVLAVPLIDLLLAVVRRTRARRSPFAPDKEHLHHRLLEIGHSQRQAVLIMYLWAGALAVGSATAAFEGVTCRLARRSWHCSLARGRSDSQARAGDEVGARGAGRMMAPTSRHRQGFGLSICWVRHDRPFHSLGRAAGAVCVVAYLVIDGWSGLRRAARGGLRRPLLRDRPGRPATDAGLPRRCNRRVHCSPSTWSRSCCSRQRCGRSSESTDLDLHATAVTVVVTTVAGAIGRHCRRDPHSLVLLRLSDRLAITRT